ncbi:hypothetical protein ACFV2X_39665 [Streptomyces sp. NPDC059679]|uniref:hypothetical protein n=1 Tax=Streptomyces sp. NPDC059679 TaxID=3346903 RepID=UPI0036B84806
MALFKKRAAGKPGEWYYCIKHQKVEEGPECRAADRLGPYPTRTEAQHAMELTAERNAEWETDPRWRDEPTRGEDTSGEGEGEGPRGAG